ncbi:MAG: tetratricopeptide repeat protein, partial [Chthoniobacterales bacterium]
MTDGCNGNVRTIERRAFLLKCGRRLGCLALVALLGCGALRGYGGWRKQHLAKQTAAFVAKGDFKSAVLVARRLLDLDPANLAACRAMAEIAEKTRSAEAINWRRKIVYGEPTSANQLALARCALAFGQRELSEAVLHAMPESARDSVDYHQIAGAEALARKDMATAEKHFAAATAL